MHDQFDYVGDPHTHPQLYRTGFIGGAQAGYNIQRGHVVFGVEGDIGYLNISGKSTAKDLDDSRRNGMVTTLPGRTVDYEGEMCRVERESRDIQRFVRPTARLGYAADRTLFYVKGGGALSQRKSQGALRGWKLLDIR